MTAVKTAVRHECVRCGKRLPADKLFYSRFTRNRYCADFSACAWRRVRKAKA